MKLSVKVLQNHLFSPICFCVCVHILRVVCFHILESYHFLLGIIRVRLFASVCMHACICGALFTIVYCLLIANIIFACFFIIFCNTFHSKTSSLSLLAKRKTVYRWTHQNGIPWNGSHKSQETLFNQNQDFSI